MTNNLTLVAALPSGGGCMSALPAEVSQVTFKKAAGEQSKVQMKAAYFEEPKEEEIDWSEIDLSGGFGC